MGIKKVKLAFSIGNLRVKWFKQVYTFTTHGRRPVSFTLVGCFVVVFVV